MMVTVKTDTDIFLNVEGFEAREGRSDKVGSHDICVERPGLYIKPTSYARYIPVIYCDVEKAKEMLGRIARMINYYYPNVLVLEVHDGEISRLRL